MIHNRPQTLYAIGCVKPATSHRERSSSENDGTASADVHLCPGAFCAGGESLFGTHGGAGQTDGRGLRGDRLKFQLDLLRRWVRERGINSTFRYAIKQT